MATDFLINRSNIRDTKIVEREDTADLKPNQIRCQIDSFAFTANNVTYATAGEMLKYWDFFPAPPQHEGWGKLPVWGFADVIESAHPDIEVGEHIYGYWPLATHLTIDVDKVRPGRFIDAAPHRQHLNALYNSYTRTSATPGFDASFDNLNSLLRPLFSTSFLIDDFLFDNDFFGAEAILISSASSKTAIGTAYQLFNNRPNRDNEVTVIGLTSAKNVEFVEGLGCYDQVFAYEDVTTIPAEKPVGYVDIAGNGELRGTIHHHFGDQLKISLAVGMSHWETPPTRGETLPGARPTFFFAPAQFQKRLQEWGSAQFNQKTAMAALPFFQMMAGSLNINIESGTESISNVYDQMVEGNVSPKEAYILSF